MTKTTTMVVMALLAGCGGADLRQTAGGSGGSSGTTGSTSEALQVDLRLRATGTDAYSSLQLLADDVQVKADGVVLPVVNVGEPMELTRSDQAFKVASVQVPKEAKEVEFTVRLAPSGLYDAGNGQGWVDARDTVLHFKSPASLVFQNQKAVMILDAARSLVPHGDDTLALVPHVGIRY